MVAIKRRPLTNARRPGSHWFSWLTVRNAILCVVVIQGVRLISRMSGSSSSTSSNTKTAPINLQNALQDSRISLKGGNPMKIRDRPPSVRGGNNNNNEPLLPDSEQAKRFHERQEHHAAPKRQPQQVHDLDTLQNNMKEHELVDEHAAQEEHNNKNETPEQHIHNEAPKQQDKQDAASKRFWNTSTHQVLTKHGTGPTQVGYVVDLAHERQNPAFRLDDKLDKAFFEDLEAKIHTQLSSKVQACEREDGDLDPKCHDEDTRLVVYNGASFVRYVCGHELEPGKAMVLKDDTHCRVGWGHVTPKDEEPPQMHLFPLPQNDHNHFPLDGKGMPPIQVTLQPGVDKDATLETISDCDVPCLWEQPSKQVVDRYIAGTDWKIRWSDKETASDRKVHMERTDHRHDVYYATTSWKSSIPLSSFSFDRYNYRQAPAIDFGTAKNAASSMLNSHCNGTPTRRHKWLAAAQAKLKEVHFYGSCQHTTDVPAGKSLDKLQDRLDLMKQDRIVLAYEAGTELWHTTEIVWEALQSGAVPAILGASNLDTDILPPHAAIYGSNYNSWDQFSEDIQAAAYDKEKWQSYQAWRTDEAALTSFEARLNFTRTDPKCRTCRWAYAKRYGLGWNHTQQTIQPNHLDHSRFCLSTNKQVAEPFVEAWSTLDAEPSSTTDNKGEVTCQEHYSHTTIETLGLKRWVWNHDGLTDIRLEPTEDKKDATIVLRLQFPVYNSEGALFRHVHTLLPNTVRLSRVSSAAIQDERSKVTVLCDFDAVLQSPAEGVVEVHIPAFAARRRIRVVTEDFDELHGKLTEYVPSSYATVAMSDFVDPLDLFYLE